jgi:DNA invertase Pin-like site-specific DNA recombinase
VVVPYDSSGKVDLIPAVAYLRKSTKGERKGAKGKRRQKQEKSIEQQKEEILKLARGRFRVAAWFTDEGISGWKRGAKRPAYTAMLAEAQALGVRAILVDNLDRFTRASNDDVQEDARELRKANVRWVITCNGQEFDLQAGQRNDIGGIITFAAAVWAAHEYSRNLGRRIALARRNAAEQGRRTGGPAPYALRDDGAGGLVPGDPDKLQVVRYIFDQFVNNLRALGWLALDLNDRHVPPPAGKRWYLRTVKLLLRQRAYRGDFSFNDEHCGHFYGINQDGEVVESAELGDTRKVFTKTGAYEPVVDPSLFDRAQERLRVIGAEPARSKRKYALSGALVCGHCGSSLVGVTPKNGSGKVGPIIYRCNGTAQGIRCRQYRVRESVILPFLMRLLGREIADLRTLVTLPPDPDRLNPARKAKEQDRDRLRDKIARAEENLLEVDDPRTLKALSAKVSTWRDDLEALESELAVEPARDPQEQAAALSKWWESFLASAVPVPVSADKVSGLGHGLPVFGAALPVIPADPRRVSEALQAVGCEVRLKWRAKGRRSVLDSGRFRLGQHSGPLANVPGRAASRPAARSASPR